MAQREVDRRVSRGRPAQPAGPRPVQLEDGDAVFLAVESGAAPSYIAGLTIVDAASASGFDFERYVELIRERVALVDRFRWRLLELPFGLDNAYWVEAEDFDPADHVRRVAVPKPGDRAALAELVGLLHGTPLDRRRPLWECWWIEGLEGGRVATLLKFHHCLMDGQSGIGLSEILLDLSPEPARTTPAEREPPGPRAPSWLEMAARAVSHAGRRPERIAVHASRALRQGIERWRGNGRTAPPPAVPKTPWNDRLSGQRAFSFATLPLAPIREVKKHFDVTVNDVLLELVSSALRRSLGDAERLPDAPIVAICPVSLRQGDDDDFGNQLSSMPVSLATDLADPVERLLAIHRDARDAKTRQAAGAFEVMGMLSECFVPGVLQVATRAAHARPDWVPVPGNLVFSNVRGLPVPLYLAGARVEEIYPMSMLQVATGLNVTAVSHDDQVDFGFLVDAELIPDPWPHARALTDALDELLVAIEERVAAQRSGSTPAPPPTSTDRAGARARPEVVRAGPFASLAAQSSPRTDQPEPTSPSTRAPRAAAPRAEETDEPEPLDLVGIMSGLAHVRAPSRKPIGRPVGEDGAPLQPREAASKSASRRSVAG